MTALAPILLNVSGTYAIPTADGITIVGDVGAHPQLQVLNDFLHALQTSATENADVLTMSFNKLLRQMKQNPTSKVEIEITTSMVGDRIVHTFAITA